MKRDLFKTGFGRALALSLASLLLLGCLAGCSQAPGGALRQHPRRYPISPAKIRGSRPFSRTLPRRRRRPPSRRSRWS